MPWFKVDDTLHSHPKTRRAGPAAMGMWVLAASYSAAYTTEGFVAEWWVAAFPTGRRRAAELVAAGFWVPSVKKGEEGWNFHDWSKYQPSKAEIEADRAAARDRQKAWRAKRRENARNAVTNAVTGGVTGGVTNGSPFPSHPIPSHPAPIPVPSHPSPDPTPSHLKTSGETLASFVQNATREQADG